ncbi:MAG: hypothetical protein H6741_20950 [Alphaproteobacteria bacterium]|nr:hypothetical protein [Alphaproteobacteria bacterium]
MDPTTAIALATLFPSADYKEVAIGFYGFEQTQAPSLADAPAAFGAAALGPEGLDLVYRRVFDTEDVRLGEADTATGEAFRLRMYRDSSGALQLDELSAETLLFSFHRRMVVGDKFDLGLLFGQWDEIWRFGDTGRMQWRFFSPLKVTLLGLANNDMDDDDQVKYYIGAGAGLGGDALVRVAGPVGLQLRADAFLQSKNRFRSGDRNTTRHELELNAELGLSGLLAQQAWILGAWGTAVTQWDPRDAEGRDGIDRQYLAAGLRVSGRFYKERREPVLEPDIEALLDALRQAERDGGEGDGNSIFDRPSGEREGLRGDRDGEKEEGEDKPEAEAPEAGAHIPVELHWSEVTPLVEPAPAYPADLDPSATCSVRFFIDPTGKPYDVRPEDCPDDMRAETMGVAWSWRFEPVVEDGDTVSAQFVYPFSATQRRELSAPVEEAGEGSGEEAPAPE